MKTILLQSNSNGGKLDFQNLALRPRQLKPIFKAIQFQQSITELCLKGTNKAANIITAIYRCSETKIEWMIIHFDKSISFNSIFIDGSCCRCIL